MEVIEKGQETRRLDPDLRSIHAFKAQADDAEGAASYWRGSRVRQAEELNLPAPLIDIAPRFRCGRGDSRASDGRHLLCSKVACFLALKRPKIS